MIGEKDNQINEYKKIITESEEEFTEMLTESEKKTRAKIEAVTEQWRSENSDNPMIKGWDSLTNIGA